ncbi:hypothetical protein HOI26_02305 [Candidatus Woesearchaeota archaeon]|jgi:hypothetical protein|nr:hypothetical protein [Candidatus Woesearchaeota archaeon]MBT5739910.1 hypothetical protein [Candidatus Woesearchaeota archaeon]
MPVLRLKVKCVSCQREVAKLESRQVPSMTKDPRYQCFLCFKRHQPIQWGLGDEEKKKQAWYCARCNYHFKAKKEKCPYCGKSDLLSAGKVAVRDLL